MCLSDELHTLIISLSLVRDDIVGTRQINFVTGGHSVDVVNLDRNSGNLYAEVIL